MSLFNPFLSSSRASSPRNVPFGTFDEGPGDRAEVLEESGVFRRAQRSRLPRGVMSNGSSPRLPADPRRD
jgi:hypothetical protein